MTEPMDKTVSTTVVGTVLVTLHVIKLLDIVIWGVARDIPTVTVGKVETIYTMLH